MALYEDGIKNAKITKTSLGVEDRGIFTFWLYLEYDGGGQGCGGYALACTPRDNEKRWANVGGLLEAIMKVAGVDAWEKLPGQYIQVKATHSSVDAIRPILSDRDEDWFIFKDFFKTAWRQAATLQDREEKVRAAADQFNKKPHEKTDTYPGTLPGSAGGGAGRPGQNQGDVAGA